MAEFIVAVEEFFESFLKNGYLVGFFASMIPIIELKGGILYMINVAECNVFLSFLVGVAGSSVIAPVLLVAFIPLVEWMKKTKLLRGIGSFLENHFRKRSTALEEKAEKKQNGASEEEKKKRIERAKYFGLFLFTAVPLPLTGCWTASVVAAILHLDYKKALPIIVLGNIVAGAAITLLWVLLGLAI
ncbi:MAG: small multi-drug export protein [Clostridia bacterium]|nr:small multi-drug export protein [Clostridia bacterium]